MQGPDPAQGHAGEARVHPEQNPLLSLVACVLEKKYIFNINIFFSPAKA